MMFTFMAIRTCLFEHEGTKVELLPSQTKNNIAEKKQVTAKQTKISLMSTKDIDRDMTIGKPIIILTLKKSLKSRSPQFPLRSPS